MRKTFVMIKPDAVNRSLIGRVITRFEEKGLRIAAVKMQHLQGDIIDEHYAHIADKPFFAEIRNYISSIPCVLMVIEGKDVVNVVRKLVGVTCGRDADVGTIRGDFAMSVQSNIVHASEDEEQAEIEIKRFFKEEEIMDYKRIDYHLIYTEMEKEPNKRDEE